MTAKAADPFVAFRNKSYARLWWGKLAASLAAEITGVAVGWQVYDLTRNPLDLGLVGLAQFAPALLLVLVTGAAADRFNRKYISLACIGIEIACAAALLGLTLGGSRVVWPILATLLGIGVGRAFFSPAAQSLVPNLVPREDLPNALAMNTTSWQMASIGGPLVGGLLYGFGPVVAYGAAAGLLCMGAALFLGIVSPPQTRSSERQGWSEVVAGFRYIWRAKILLGAISLDLFAVLLSGAVALMPAYARDILQTGPWGLGILRSAGGIGAILMALYLSFRPIRDHAGAVMFAGVAAFGAFTVIFGVSETLWVSVAALAIMGAADMLSVYVREILVQLATPDAVRGRVNAVNMVFVGASNELGAFRAGTMAHFIGVVPAVVVGGVAAVAVAGLWSVWFPELRRARRLTDVPVVDADGAGR